MSRAYRGRKRQAAVLERAPCLIGLPHSSAPATRPSEVGTMFTSHQKRKQRLNSQVESFPKSHNEEVSEPGFDSHALYSHPLNAVAQSDGSAWTADGKDSRSPSHHSVVHCCGLEFPPHSSAAVLTPKISECGLIWRQGLYIGNQGHWGRP